VQISELSFKRMKRRFETQSNIFIGLLFLFLINATSCQQGSESESKRVEFAYDLPVDSGSFNYDDRSGNETDRDYVENRFGRGIFKVNNHFVYKSIDSENRLHSFDFSTNTHSYSKKICNSKIDGFKIENERIYLLYDSIFFVKDHLLNTIDSFPFPSPIIDGKHSIDFSMENGSNIIKNKDFFGVVYYQVDPISGNYGNTEKIFYLFNKDTAFFVGQNCQEVDTTFQYFRYPCVAEEEQFIYFSPKIGNCISRVGVQGNEISAKIDSSSSRYLTLNSEDQYQISRLKKYRLSSDYNRRIILSNDYVFLLKEFKKRSYVKDNIMQYERDLILKKFDKNLNAKGSIYIKNTPFSNIYLEGNTLYLFSFLKQKFYVYEV